MPPLLLAVDDLSRAGEARRAASAFVLALGADESFAGRVALVVTEAATNAARHGRGGHLVVRALGGGFGVEILAVDAGPGMADPERCLRDGFSTGGSSGAGLGAIRRAADVFDLYSRAGGGTIVLAQLAASPAAPPAHVPQIGVVATPAPGERVRGDGWAVEQRDWCTRALVCDGLGHGPAAHEAAARALAVFRGSSAVETPAAMLQRMHLALHATRGAAVAVAYLDPRAARLRFAGIGNVAASLLGPGGSRSLASHNGIVGHQLSRAQEFDAPWGAGFTLVLHSDGIRTRWRADDYPSILGHHPAVLAAAIHRDGLRGRDDATVLAVRTPTEARPA